MPNMTKKYQEKYRKENKNRINQVRREWRRKNKEKIKEKRDEYREENKDHIHEISRRYKENNNKSIKRYNKKYSKRVEVMKRENKRRQLKRDTDPIFRLNNSLSTGVRISLKNNNLSKNRRRWENLVGYTKKELKGHLEKLFKSGMSWDNYGQWHIDHIIPLSFFRYKSTDDVEFKYCWSLYNLQPLWKKDNVSKNDKIFINNKMMRSSLLEKEV